MAQGCSLRSGPGIGQPLVMPLAHSSAQEEKYGSGPHALQTSQPSPPKLPESSSGSSVIPTCDPARSTHEEQGQAALNAHTAQHRPQMGVRLAGREWIEQGASAPHPSRWPTAPGQRTTRSSDPCAPCRPQSQAARRTAPGSTRGPALVEGAGEIKGKGGLAPGRQPPGAGAGNTGTGTAGNRRRSRQAVGSPAQALRAAQSQQHKWPTFSH